MLQSFQKKYLRGLAHDLKPLVFVGQKGVTQTLLEAVNQALLDHELIKIKFNDFKYKDQKQGILTEIETRTASSAAGLIGHTAIIFRRHPDPEKRKVVLPEK